MNGVGSGELSVGQLGKFEADDWDSLLYFCSVFQARFRCKDRDELNPV